MTTRVAENSRSGIIGALWGAAVWYAMPGSGFLFTVLGADITATFSPEHIEQFVIGLATALGITGGVSAWYRDKPSSAQAVVNIPVPVQPVVEPEQPANIPAPTIRKPQQTNYFSDAELDCKCRDLPDCDYQGMDPEALRLFNELRTEFGPLFVNSAYRCDEHNRNVGGADDSYHKKAMAGDLRSPTVSPQAMYAWLVKKYPEQYGFGVYAKFIHVDSRQGVYARKPTATSPWREYPKADVKVA